MAAIRAVADGGAIWWCFHLEPAYEEAEVIDAATGQAVTAVSGPLDGKDGSA